jgi:hypothetical protein
MVGAGDSKKALEDFEFPLSPMGQDVFIHHTSHFVAG